MKFRDKIFAMLCATAVAFTSAPADAKIVTDKLPLLTYAETPVPVYDAPNGNRKGTIAAGSSLVLVKVIRPDGWAYGSYKVGNKKKRSYRWFKMSELQGYADFENYIDKATYDQDAYRTRSSMSLAGKVSSGEDLIVVAKRGDKIKVIFKADGNFYRMGWVAKTSLSKTANDGLTTDSTSNDLLTDDTNDELLTENSSDEDEISIDDFTETEDLTEEEGGGGDFGGTPEVDPPMIISELTPYEQPDELENVPLDELENAPPDELENAPPDELENIPPDELENVPPDEVENVPPDELENVPPDELENVPPDEVENAPPDELENAPPDELENIPPDELENIPPDELENIPPDELENIPPDELENIPPDELENVPPDEVENVPPDELENVPPDELENIPPDELENVPPDELENVPPDELENAGSTIGDVNNDGSIDAIDIALLQKYLKDNSTSVNLANADLNGDGFISVFDVNVLLNLVKAAGKGTGDVNGDGKIDLYDVQTLSAYLAKQTVTLNRTNADLNGDGSIDDADLKILREVIATRK